MKYNIAILGATGAVGESLLEILDERNFPVDNLYPLASHRSMGETVYFKNKACGVLDVADFDFSKVHIAFFSAGAKASEQYAELAASKGCLVIDNTSFFRNQPDVPLVVPEVNPEEIRHFNVRRIIANPNCSTIQMVVALKPIYDAVGITRINVATYQSVSGTGKAAIEELAQQTRQALTGGTIEKNVYPHQIAFNLLPHIDDFEENGYTREEMKMVNETRKILNDVNIVVNPTAVRVPVFYGHAAAIHIETRQKLTANEARELFKKAPGIQLEDEPGNSLYPHPISHAGKDAVFVGRVREDISHHLGLNLWVVADNIRKGAALNSIQIAELWIKNYC